MVNFICEHWVLLSVAFVGLIIVRKLLKKNPIDKLNKDISSSRVRLILKWEHKTWGDNICIGDPNCGWLTRRPNNNDLLAIKCKSGYVGVFKISNVEYVEDPNDMFFFELSSPVAYLSSTYDSLTLDPDLALRNEQVKE